MNSPPGWKPFPFWIGWMENWNWTSRSLMVTTMVSCGFSLSQTIDCHICWISLSIPIVYEPIYSYLQRSHSHTFPIINYRMISLTINHHFWWLNHHVPWILQSYSSNQPKSIYQVVEKSDQLSSISYKSEITMFKLLKSPVFPMVFQWNSYGKTEEVGWTTMVGRFYRFRMED